MTRESLPPDALPDDAPSASHFAELLPLTDAGDIGELTTCPSMPDDDSVLGAGRGQFLYIGDGLKADAFANYVQNYHFGSKPPTFVVLHHTATPQTLYARGSGWFWDANEAGMSEQQTYAKRQRQLAALRNYYQRQLGWDRGPHLFIDDRWIWLFTPMYYPGIHAAAGNGNTTSYSIGIEVVGYYERVHWPKPVERLVGQAIAVLKQHLGTFDLTHKRFGGGVSSHRDYNKPSCPGAAITEAYYLGVLRREWTRLQSGEEATKSTPVSPDSPILGPSSGGMHLAADYIQAHLPANSEYSNDVELIMSYYWKYAPAVGVDPFLAAAQCIFETDALRSHWAGRPRRNPAGLGVRQEGGLSFATWELAVQAHIGQLLALALRNDEANDAQRQMMRKNPRHDRICQELRGLAKTLAGLNNRWTNDPNYASSLVRRVHSVQQGGTLGTTATDANWFDDTPVIGKLPQAEAAAQLQEIGGEEDAAAVLGAAEPQTQPGETAVLGLGWPFGDRAWQHTAHTFGYIPPAMPGTEPVPITFAGNISADETLRHGRIKLTLNGLRIADYPGRGMHRILFDFYGQNQIADGIEHLHYNATYRIRSGERAAVVGYPIFVGLNVGKEGVIFKCYTVNVQNDHDEAFLSMLETDVFKAGLQVAATVQPAMGPLSAMALGMTKAVAQRNRNISVQEFAMGLDFGTTPGGLRLAEGAYLAVQIPEDRATAWDWNEWVYDPTNGQVVNQAEPTQLIPYNYLMFGVSRHEDEADAGRPIT